MVKHFCCCFSLKTGAIFMAFLNLLEGFSEFVIGLVHLIYATTEGNITLFVVCLLLGIFTMANGVVLLIGIVQAKEKLVLIYLLLSSVCLLVVTIYAGCSMFEIKILILISGLSVLMWYGQYCVYNFYDEVAEYNSVNAGVIEIAYKGDGKTFDNPGVTPQRSVENTAV